MIAFASLSTLFIAERGARPGHVLVPAGVDPCEKFPHGLCHGVHGEAGGRSEPTLPGATGVSASPTLPTDRTSPQSRTLARTRFAASARMGSGKHWTSVRTFLPATHPTRRWGRPAPKRPENRLGVLGATVVPIPPAAVNVVAALERRGVFR
jgi:hypothetical protein